MRVGASSLGPRFFRKMNPSPSFDIGQAAAGFPASPRQIGHSRFEKGKNKSVPFCRSRSGTGVKMTMVARSAEVCANPPAPTRSTV